MVKTCGKLALCFVLVLPGCGEARVCTAERGQAIIDGSLARAADYSATAALLVHAEAQGEVLAELACSAVLIAPDVVLTAAHCVALYQFDDEPELPPVDWFVSFETDVSQFEELGGPPPDTALSVRALILHPGFSLERRAPQQVLGKMDDLALLFLSQPVLDVEPVPFFQAGAELQSGVDVQVAGYGLVSLDDPDAGLGVKRHGTSRLLEVGEDELRVGRALSQDEQPGPGLVEKCYGDSGGPTFVEVDGRPWLIGVASRGVSPAAGCAVAGVDTRIDAYEDWIVQTAQLACVDGRRDPAVCVHFPVAPRARGEGTGPDATTPPAERLGGCEDASTAPMD